MAGDPAGDASGSVRRMRGVRVGTDGVAVQDVPEPEGDGVLIDVVSAGICGSDLHLVDLGPRPTTLGHEIGGLLDSRPVTFSPLVFCGACERCRDGRGDLCSTGTAAIVGIARDGGMADQVLVDPSAVVVLPEGTDPAVACLVEPVAVAVHACNVGRIEPGMRVAVIGAGTVGLVAGSVARAYGATVDIAARHPVQEAAAEKLGLGRAIGRGYDVVVDGAGTASALAQAVKVARPGADVVVAGTYWGEVALPGLAFQLKGLRLLPAIYYGHHAGEREIDAAARLFADLPDLADALITHRFPLDAAAEAFRTAADKSTGAVKVVLEP